MALVLDASVTLSWIMRQESAGSGEEVYEAIARDHAIVPSVWHFEVANVLSRSLSAGLLTRLEVERFARELSTLDIRIEPVTEPLFSLVVFAQTQQLSGYDAAYLQLAMMRSLPIATLDEKLASRARLCGIAVVGMDQPCT